MSLLFLRAFNLTVSADALEQVVVPLFAFFVMKTKRERDSYLASAAEHGRIAEGLLNSSAEELRQLMRKSVGECSRGIAVPYESK